MVFLVEASVLIETAARPARADPRGPPRKKKKKPLAPSPRAYSLTRTTVVGFASLGARREAIEAARQAVVTSWDGLGGLALASLAVLELLRGHA